MSPDRRPVIAVVGGGIAGLAAAWELVTGRDSPVGTDSPSVVILEAARPARRQAPADEIRRAHGRPGCRRIPGTPARGNRAVRGTWHRRRVGPGGGDRGGRLGARPAQGAPLGVEPRRSHPLGAARPLGNPLLVRTGRCHEGPGPSPAARARARRPSCRGHRGRTAGASGCRAVGRPPGRRHQCRRGRPSECGGDLPPTGDRLPASRKPHAQPASAAGGAGPPRPGRPPRPSRPPSPRPPLAGPKPLAPITARSSGPCERERQAWSTGWWTSFRPGTSRYGRGRRSSG